MPSATHRRFLSDALLRGAKLPPWEGEVERREPASYQQRSEVLIRLCRNVYCRHWTPTRLTRCVICKT